MELGIEYPLTVYKGIFEMTLICRPMERVGLRYVAILSTKVPEGSFAKINCGSVLEFGEVWACWETDGCVHAVLSLTERLSTNSMTASGRP